MFNPFSRLAKRIARTERGQSLVEMALALPILLLVLAGLLDLGRIYFVYVALEDGAGEGALYLSINPECGVASDGPNCANPNNAEYRAKHSGGLAVDWTNTTIEVDRPVIGVGEPVKVTIRYPFRLVTPIIPRLLGIDVIPLTSVATQIIVSEPLS